MNEEHVVVLILDRIVSHLTLKCITEIDEDDITRADVIKKGLLQENRVQKNISLGVQAGDHENPDYIDGIITLEELKNIALNFEPREIGGGEYWWRRGVVRVESFFIREKLTEDAAFVAAYQVLGRVQNNLQSMSLSGIEDSWGEGAIILRTYANTYFESGGKPNQFLFRGKVFWACLTWRP